MFNVSKLKRLRLTQTDSEIREKKKVHPYYSSTAVHIGTSEINQSALLVPNYRNA